MAKARFTPFSYWPQNMISIYFSKCKRVLNLLNQSQWLKYSDLCQMKMDSCFLWYIYYFALSLQLSHWSVQTELSLQTAGVAHLLNKFSASDSIQIIKIAQTTLKRI